MLIVDQTANRFFLRLQQMPPGSDTHMGRLSAAAHGAALAARDAMAAREAMVAREALADRWASGTPSLPSLKRTDL
jgi:hypothetical protein